MIRELMKYLDASFCAEAALFLFLLVFVSITIRTLWFTRRTQSHAQAVIPLSDGTEVTRS